jgi:hypothetical protein
VTRNVRHGFSRRLPAVAVVALALAAWTFGGASGALAGNPVPEPHSSCEREGTDTSRDGVAEANLTVINLTEATFDLFWLDYDGARVFYQTVLPSSTQQQPTWITHPWILADEAGTCYLLIVMTAVEQTMTIGTTTGQELETPPGTPPPRPPQTEPTETDPEESSAAVPTQTEEEPPGFPTPLVIAGLVMMGVAVGLLFATGKLFGGPKKPAP